MTIDDRLGEAKALLTALGFDSGRANDRSARVFLALVQVRPEDDWADASTPMLGVRAIADWIRASLEMDYAENTRETLRRQTLHQFKDAGMVALNVDDPSRATNSPHSNYMVVSEALEVIKKYGTPEFDSALAGYLITAPGLAAIYGAARNLARIPVTLPNGELITLSGGGQNVLLKTMVEDFCSVFTPGGHVLYIGDADEKLAVFDVDALAKLGVVIETHGKMPDLIVYMPDKNWLVLLEAASSHGPVDAKRHGELKTLFAGSSAGLVYVSCFPDRQTMRKYLTDLAWETEAWNAAEQTHLIHLNGSRFLGPYA